MKDSIQERLTENTLRVYKKNRVNVRGMQFHQPALGEYESIFGWDSGWHMIAVSAFEPEIGIRELEATFNFQFDDGRIPHTSRIKELGRSQTPFTRFYMWTVRSQFDEHGRSYEIDPPTYIHGAKLLYDRTSDERILKVLPRMQACLDYLIEKRNLLNDGLVSIVHPWETCEAAPYFDEALRININRPPGQWKFEVMYHVIMRKLSKHGWNMDEVVRRKQFVFEDVLFNGLTALAAISLANLWKEAGDLTKAAEAERTGRKLSAAIEEHLWDDERGFFYPRWQDEGWPFPEPKKSFRSVANGVAPLLTGLISQDKAMRVIDEYIDSEEHFACPYGISFNSLSEEDVHRFWPQMLARGPCMWINQNWISAEAAALYGRHDVARRITTRTAKMLDRTGFREFFNPHTGEGAGAYDFTWPGLIVDMMQKHGIDE